MKFDKENFSKILTKIKNTYGSINQMAEKTGVTSAYLSKLIRLMYDNAPSPEILKKIADNSNGVISYYELMIFCGYVDFENIDIDKLIDDFFDSHPDAKFSISYQDLKNRTLEENIVLNNLFRNYRNIILQSKDLGINYDLFVKNLPKFSQDKVHIIWGIYITHLIELINKFNLVKNNNVVAKEINIIQNISAKSYMCPVYGQISARQPILVDENIEGYLPIDPNTYGETTSDNLFYLKISDESMNLKVKNGDYVLIRKQDYAEDGDIIIAIANDEATLKRYKKLNDQFILLEPMSTDPSIEAITIDLKNNNFKIIGKAIGQFGKF